MTTSLVVGGDFSTFHRGDRITNTSQIAAVRAGEYASQVVVVSDEAIPPPPPPPAAVDLASLQQTVTSLGLANVSQDQALGATAARDAAQEATLQAQAQALSDLAAQLALLRARVDAGAGGGGGTPVSPQLGDDLPLAENDGVVLATNSGAVLAGDIR